MRQRSTITPAWIAPGIAVPTRRPESFMEALRRKQRECAHAKRDPKGTCYECGHQEPGQTNCRICGSETSKWHAIRHNGCCVSCQAVEAVK